MLLDERRARTFDAFADAWGGLDSLDVAATHAGGARGLDVPTLQLMRAETVRFLDAVLYQGDGKLATLFTAPWSVADPRLAKEIYASNGVPDSEGKIQLDPSQRAGILSHASVLFAHSHSEQTSPVLRGKWVREVLLCQKVPDPPPTVNAMPPPPEPGQTTRERFSAHRTQSSCAACHSLMDDIGFGFESYDQDGRFRAMEEGKPVDTRGTLRATDVDGDFMGVPELGKKLASSQMASDCFARQWFRYGLGHSDGKGESCFVTRMSSAVRDGGGFKALVHELVRSDAFRRRRTP
jgi:hypothetical protein